MTIEAVVSVLIDIATEAGDIPAMFQSVVEQEDVQQKVTEAEVAVFGVERPAA